MTGGIAILLIALFAALVTAHQPPSGDPEQNLEPRSVVLRVQGAGALPASWRTQQIVGSGYYIEVPAGERDEAVARLSQAGFEVVQEWGAQ